MVLRLSELVIVIVISLIFGMGTVLIHKGKWSILSPIIFGLITSVVFGLIRAMFSLIGDDKWLSDFMENRGVPIELVPLFVGSLSASVLIFIASYLEPYLGERFIIIKNPFLDMIGIFIGTGLISLGYIVYLEYKKSHGKSMDATSVNITKHDPIIL